MVVSNFLLAPVPIWHSLSSRFMTQSIAAVARRSVSAGVCLSPQVGGLIVLSDEIVALGLAQYSLGDFFDFTRGSRRFASMATGSRRDEE